MASSCGQENFRLQHPLELGDSPSGPGSSSATNSEEVQDLVSI